MKIAESQVAMAASHSRVETTYERESLEIWRGGRQQATVEGQGGALRPTAEALIGRASSTSLTLSGAARSVAVVRGEVDDQERTARLDSKSQFELSLIKLVVEHITGRRIKLFDPAELEADKDGGVHAPVDGGEPAVSARNEGFGLRYEYHAVHRESERSQFRAEGVVTTADGQEIGFVVNLAMSRDFASETHVNLQVGAAMKDPLVVNFDGNAAELGERDFSFDIDLDGHAEQIAFVRGGSGFLALDRNGDGVVNDGSELFGPNSGDGFAELAQYDEDGNNWIDENDAIYDSLRIWSRNGDSLQLLGLGTHNIGAIYLGNVTTPFSLNDAQNNPLGKVQSTGIYLAEDGGAGTLQHVDLVV